MLNRGCDELRDQQVRRKLALPNFWRFSPVSTWAIRPTAVATFASELGVLIKGGAALEALGAVRGLALDKTGTLTRNRPAVVSVTTTPGVTRQHVLAVAAALEARSEHPLARAILAAVDDLTPATDVEAIPGAGLTGRLDGRTVRLGRPGWLDPGDLADDVERMQHAGATAVLVEDDGRIIGAVAVRDELRPEAKARLVAELRTQRVTAMVGDGSTTHPHWPPPTSASPSAPWAPTSPSRPPTSRSWARTYATYPKPSTTPAAPAPSCCRTSDCPWPSSWS